MICRHCQVECEHEFCSRNCFWLWGAGVEIRAAAVRQGIFPADYWDEPRFVGRYAIDRSAFNEMIEEMESE